jgi:hypothetical protein
MFYRIAFRKKVYRSIKELQADLDSWIKEYNEAHPQQKLMFRQAGCRHSLDAMPIAKEKIIAA